MITAIRPQAVPVQASSADIPPAAWVADYRSQVPTADRWARGLRNRTHTDETQARVFRMAEQLVGLGIDRQALLTNLEAADRSVASAVDPEAAAEAGYRAIAPLLLLFGAPIVVASDEGDPDLRAFGFETIPFDGHDPAAYAWAMFEITMRARNHSDRMPCNCHLRAASSAIGLACL